ncbi:MAG: adenylate/guanylate cyclase domain-containing protein [bacterium]
MQDNDIIKKIRELTVGFKGKDDPAARLAWLGSLVDSYKRYLPSRVVEKIALDPSTKKVEGERRNITVAFADLSGFTALSETMDPEDIANIINDFFTRMLKIVFKYEGSVDKFLGDALMVLFGAPIAHHDDPERAVRAALEMQQEMQRFNKENKAPTPLAMSIGINTGPAVALNVGSEDRMEYTVIGDAVNLAARLEGVSKAGEIIISHNTYQKIADVVEVEKKPSVKVKGKKKPILNYLVKEMREHYKLPDITKLEIVGRQQERQIIEACLADTKKNQITILGVVGEPGTGKTRIGLEAVLLARKDNFSTFNGRSMPYETNSAYATVISLLNDYFKIKKEASEQDKKLLISLKLKNLGLSLDETMPYIGALYGLQFAEIENIPPDELKKRIFYTIKDVILNEAKRSPLLVRIEDAQWSDPTSNEFFNYLFNSVGEAQILLLFEYRSDFAFPWLTHPNYKNIALKGFSKEETIDYSQKILETLSVAPEILDTIYNKSLGNPLFIQEILKFLMKKGGIRKRKGQAVASSRFKNLEIAESISGVILDQIDRMSESDRHLLQYASVVGKIFRPPLLSTITNIPLDELLKQLERLEHFEGILTSHPDAEETIYEFMSPTTYEVVYGSLFKTRRKQLHLQIGETLEKQFSDRLFENSEQLAYHFVNSTDKTRGINYTKLAADKSYRLYALKESVNFFQQALDLLGRKDLVPEQMQDKLEVLRRQGFVLRLLGELNQALLNQKRSLKIAHQTESLKDEAGACLNIGIIFQEMGVPKKGLSYWTRARRIAKKIGEKNIHVLSVNNLGNYYLHTGDLEKAFGYFTEAQESSKEMGDKRGLALATASIGEILETRGDLPKALEYYNNAYGIFEEINEKENIIRCLNQIGLLNIGLGNMEDSMTMLTKAKDLAAESGDKNAESLALGNIGLVYAQMWQLDQAYEEFSQALSLAQMVGDPTQIISMSTNIGDIHCYRGNLKQAIENHQKAIDVAQQIQDPSREGQVRKSIAWDYYHMADYNRAREEFSKGQRLFQKIGDLRHGAIMSIGIAAVMKNLGFYEQTEQMLTGFEMKAREINDLEILAQALDLKSDIYLDTADYEKAKKTLEELPGLSRKTGNKRLYAWFLGKMAMVLLKSNNMMAAKEHLDKSNAFAQEIGDKILSIANLIVSVNVDMAKSEYTEALNKLIKVTEQAKVCDVKEYYALGVLLTSKLFKRLGRNQDADKYLSDYNKIVESITAGLSEEEKQSYLKRLNKII